MDKIKQLLKEQGRQIDDAAIQGKLTEYGLNPANVSDADAQTIADELLPNAQQVANLTISNGKPATASSKARGNGGGRKSAKQVNLKDAIVKAAKQTETQIGSLEDTIRSQKKNYLEQRSESFVDEIQNTSTEYVEIITNKLMEVESDPDTFREIGTELGQGLFPLNA